MVAKDELLLVKRPFQPDGSDVHGIVEPVFLGGFYDLICGGNVGVGELEFHPDFGAHRQVLVLSALQNLEHDDVFFRHAAIVDRVVFSHQRAALISEGPLRCCVLCRHVLTSDSNYYIKRVTNVKQNSYKR